MRLIFVGSAHRNYRLFDARAGYPAGDDLYYECAICGDVLPSCPKEGIGCSCDNIFIDVDAGKVAVKEASKLRVFATQDGTDETSH